jgi:hypothetical protein
MSRRSQSARTCGTFGASVRKSVTMPHTDEQLAQMLASPRELLDLELKQWLDPTTDEGKSKIAKGCIALRNYNGGQMIIGFTDQGQPDPAPPPANLETLFQNDAIQAIISKYSAQVFGVEVEFGVRGGQKYPIITVGPGVTSPVAAKADLKTPDGKKFLIRDNTVYVRSLSSSGIVSSTEARRDDWEPLILRCFNNREADIGAFVRRHLGALVPALTQVANQPTTEERLLQALDFGRSQFLEATKIRKLASQAIGYRESVIVIDGEVPEQEVSQELRRRLLLNPPRTSGWPPFVDLDGGGAHTPNVPYFTDTALEALVANLPPEVPVIGYYLNFWRIEPSGRFFEFDGLEDDLRQDQVEPLKSLDFVLQIVRPAEMIVHGIYFARELGCDSAKTTLLCRFRWSKLANRTLTSWYQLSRRLRFKEVATQDAYLSPVVAVPLDTPPTAIAPHVQNAVKGLFRLFNGREFDPSIYEDIVRQTAEGRL